MFSDAKILHIVVAAGTGSRFGSELPKQFCDMAGRPVVMHTVDALRCHGSGKVVLVISDPMMETWRNLCHKHHFDSPDTVPGGATRWQSVKNAIDTFGGEADMITVHDGARPLLSQALITRLLSAVYSGCKAVIPALQPTDSLRQLSPSGTSVSVDRSQFRAVQTPQAFDGALLREAYSRPQSPAFTDDASVAENIGAEITLVEGDPTNIKITHPLDLAIAELIFRSSNS
jgi:2-C-methyl-D-erythritol 4-phosphate cytidylyltransferase